MIGNPDFNFHEFSPDYSPIILCRFGFDYFLSSPRSAVFLCSDGSGGTFCPKTTLVTVCTHSLDFNQSGFSKKRIPSSTYNHRWVSPTLILAGRLKFQSLSFRYLRAPQ